MPGRNSLQGFVEEKKKKCETILHHQHSHKMKFLANKLEDLTINDLPFQEQDCDFAINNSWPRCTVLFSTCDLPFSHIISNLFDVLLSII